jgi:AcrR family transcriptional regulator
VDGNNFLSEQLVENKEVFLEFATSKFLKFGSKRYTIDDFAHEMGISKKTIYQHFSSKEDIVQESLVFMLDKIKDQIENMVEKEKSNPIQGVISIYRIGFYNLKRFSPSFLLGLKKYYPKVKEQFNDFRTKEVHTPVLRLLKQAQTNVQIRANVNLALTCKLYLNRLEYVLFTNNNLFDQYSNQELLEHLIINNLRGIASDPTYMDREAIGAAL